MSKEDDYIGREIDKLVSKFKYSPQKKEILKKFVGSNKWVVDMVEDGEKHFPGYAVEHALEIGLRDIAEKKEPNPGMAFAEVYFRDLKTAVELDPEYLTHCYERGLFDKRVYESALRIAKEREKKSMGQLEKALKVHEESARSGLLKKAAVILLLIGGVYYIFKSIPNITGGVIGTAASSNILVGIVLFAFALAISHFYIK